MLETAAPRDYGIITSLVKGRRLPVLEVLGRTAVELQGSGAGAESEAQGSLLFRGGTEGVVPHGSTGAAGFEPEPWRKGDGERE